MTKRYSHSSIEAYNNCPRQYKFAYVEKVSVEKKLSVDLLLGSTVHRALENLYRTKLNGKVIKLDELVAYYDNLWEDTDKEKIIVVRENDAIEDFIKVGRDSLSKYYEKYHPFDDGQTLNVEEYIDFPLDPNNRFNIRGRIDRLSRLDDGTVEVIDYKTKAQLPSQRSLDDDNQMGIYLIAVKYLWPDFTKLRAKQIFIRHGVEMTTEMNDDQLEEIRYRVFQNILKIEESLKNDNFPPQESHLCSWCQYYDLCPAKRHKLVLDGNQDAEFDEKVGEKLADEYIRLDQEIKSKTAELKALKSDIIRFCDETELTRLSSDVGHVNVRFTETDEFPSKTANSEAFLNLTILARDAGLDEAFKLDQNLLYKDFYSTEKLPPELMEQMKVYLLKKKTTRVTARGKKNKLEE